ncbi:AraC-like ligand binding domain-containing protein [Dyella sp. OK004]|uniref:helix-turn-helix transcriptional regulator n=1 Tax=Dyella sp. OK004 TaxID=1855292 RepID=UPI0008E4BD59|nr:helix-turn-helix domain-containing protein [Dyella sp. OK004]SFS18398.1 AraC-like ligand binding domain-containing protein [Dyella sp. OK004]
MQMRNWIQSARVAHYGAGLTIPQHRHSEASLCLVVNGSYAQRTRGHEDIHHAGHLLFCPADEPHGQVFAQGGALKILLYPGPSMLEYLGQRVALGTAPFTYAETLVELAGRLCSELLRPDGCSALIVEETVLEAANLLGHAPAADAVRAPWLRRARDYIESRAFDAFSLADLAHAVDRHPMHVAREFKRSYQRTVGDYVREIRVRHAAALLRQGRQPLAEIASLCGFYDQAHLTRSFRTIHGITPGRYRLGTRQS